jgi:hypothetical protein
VRDRYEFICVWCGCNSHSRGYICSAPDGDGHLFKRTLVSGSETESMSPHGGKEAVKPVTENPVQRPWRRQYR